MAGNLLVLSGHDFRSKRKAGIHFVTDASKPFFVKRSFFSLGYSYLSKLKGDPRYTLNSKANKWENVRGVDCFLWNTGLHPVNLPYRSLRPFVAPLYKIYAQIPCAALDDAIKDSETVVLESGLAAMFIPRVRRLAPSARLIYFCSDLLETIGVHPIVERMLQEGLDEVDIIRIAARQMRLGFPRHETKVRYIPHGLAVDQLSKPMVTPYRSRINICSVGSMLFDPSFFEAVAPSFPHVDFHIIGSGFRGNLGVNVHILDEMPFEDTLPYVRFSDAVVAPYRESAASVYLADSSLKLRQAAYYGVPAICPKFAVGDDPSRFGYVPNDRDSAIQATTAALGAQRGSFLDDAATWSDVATMLFDPTKAKAGSVAGDVFIVG